MQARNRSCLTPWVLGGTLVTVWQAAAVHAAPMPYATADASTALLYHFDEGTGTTTDDAAANDRDATLSSSSSWVSGMSGFGNAVQTGATSNVAYTDTGTGKSSFLYVGRRVNSPVGAATLPTTPDFTGEMWIKGASITGTAQTLFAVAAGTNPPDYHLQITATGTLALSDNLTANKVASGVLSWDADTWYHVAVVVDQTASSASDNNGASSYKIYRTVAGDTTADEVASIAFTGTGNGGRLNSVNDAGDRTLWLGKGNGGTATQTFGGIIDEFRYSTKARTADEFTTLIPEPGTAALGALGLSMLAWRPRRSHD